MQKKAILLGSLFLLSSAVAVADGLRDSSDDSLYNSNLYVGLQTNAYYTGNAATVATTSFHPQNSHYGMDSGLFAGLGTNFNSFYLGTELGSNFQPRPDRTVNPDRTGVLFYNPYQFYADIMPGIINGTWLYFARAGVEGDVHELNTFDSSGNKTFSDSKFSTGLRAGLGLEDRISSGVTLRAGATFVHMFPLGINPGADEVSMRPYYIEGNIGASYHFNADEWAPVGESVGLIDANHLDRYRNNVYTGVQTGVYYTKDFKGFSDGLNPKVSQSQDESFGLINGVYAGMGTDFKNGFYIGSEMGANVEARPDRVSGHGNVGSLLYAPYQFYADIMPGIIDKDSGTLFFARLGAEGDHEVFEREGAATQTKFSPGLRAGLGLEDPLNDHVSLRLGGTFIDMFKIQMGDMVAHPYDVVGNVGISYRLT